MLDNAKLLLQKRVASGELLTSSLSVEDVERIAVRVAELSISPSLSDGEIERIAARLAELLKPPGGKKPAGAD